MSFDLTFLSEILPDDQIGETLVDWSDSAGFTTVNISMWKKRKNSQIKFSRGLAPSEC